MKKIAYWDWRSEPLPDAGVVVCAPFAEDPGERVGDPIAADMSYRRDRHFVVPFADARDYETWASEWVRRSMSPWGRHIIPALHVERQADLAGLHGLLAVKANLRALVCSPREDLDIFRAWGDPFRGPSGVAVPIDWILIVGGDEPMSPAHVRGIVEQARAAGVPVTFLGWGEYLPETQTLPRELRMSDALGMNDEDIDGLCYLCVGRERSGALLDGEVIDERPEALR